MPFWSPPSKSTLHRGTRSKPAVFDLICASFIGALFGCGGPDIPPPPPDLSTLPSLPDRLGDVELPRHLEEQREQVPVTIAFVGEVRGEIEPCGCPTLPYGGFERRERLLDRLRAEEAVVHLDAGELLVKGLITSSEAERIDRARAVLELSKQVGVQAWAPGPTDLLALGLRGLRDVAAGRLDGPPPVSATWQGKDGALVLPPFRVVEAGSLKIGVVGLSAEPTAPELRGQVTTLDPVEAAKDAVQALPPNLDLVLALGNVADADADRVALEVPGIAAVLTTRGRVHDDARQDKSGTPLVVESTDRGRYLTVVRTQLGAGSGAPLLMTPGDSEWKTLRTLLRQQVAVADGKAEDRAAAQRRVAEKQARFAEVGKGRNLAHVSYVPLAEDLDGDTAVGKSVADFKDESLERAAARAAEPPPPLTPTYAASAGCVSCHLSEFARWAHSDHARAWESLQVRQEVDNPECVGCHTTGFGAPGGFGELTRVNLSKFKAVQCEACHGPMAGHPDDRRVGPRAITPERCQSCHDAANSPDFDFETYLARATCQGGEPEVLQAAP